MRDAEDDGFQLVFANASSEKIEGISKLGGYGVYSENCISLSEPMPLNMKQTNNAAELMAALRTLQLHPFGKLAICSDSEYVLLGAKGAAKRWKIKGWVGSCGLVSNIPIWELFLAELEREGRKILWIKVPSHVTITGNNEADRLTKIGLHAHPLYPFHQTPHKEATVASTPLPPLKRARTDLGTPLTMDIAQRLNFSVASPGTMPLDSDHATALLTTLCLEPMDELRAFSLEDVPDPGGSNTASTVSWVPALMMVLLLMSVTLG